MNDYNKRCYDVTFNVVWKTRICDVIKRMRKKIVGHVVEERREVKFVYAYFFVGVLSSKLFYVSINFVEHFCWAALSINFVAHFYSNFSYFSNIFAKAFLSNTYEANQALVENSQIFLSVIFTSVLWKKFGIFSNNNDHKISIQFQENCQYFWQH